MEYHYVSDSCKNIPFFWKKYVLHDMERFPMCRSFLLSRLTLRKEIFAAFGKWWVFIYFNQPKLHLFLTKVKLLEDTDNEGWYKRKLILYYEHSLTLLLYLAMFMLSFIYVIISGIFELKWICSRFLLFVYICIVVGDHIIRGGIWNLITPFNPTIRRVWRNQRGNQNPYIEEEQDNTMAKRKRTKGQTTICKTFT